MKFILSVLLILPLLQACGGGSRPAEASTHGETNGVYYWKTRFNPDSSELDFLSRHKVGRVYLRMFDVTREDYNTVVPNASVIFPCDSCVAAIDAEFVPVVYITVDALRASNDNIGDLAANIVTRARNMCSYHELPGVSELQLDCDWTQNTREIFYALCDSVRSCITAQKLDWCVSSTIRLHQLAQTPPPVDRGVLMVYNTGSFDDPEEENSIISHAAVEPYLDRLPSYPLHLDVAYPLFSWQLLFRGRKFIGLLKGLDVGDTTQFSMVAPGRYRSEDYTDYNGHSIYSGDIIRCEDSHWQRLSVVKRQIEKKMKGRPHSNIIYHLDSSNLSKYTSNEIDTLFNSH